MAKQPLVIRQFPQDIPKINQNLRELARSLTYENLKDGELSSKSDNITLDMINDAIKMQLSVGDYIQQIGSGTNVLKVDTNGMYLGNETFASAPFSVDYAGNLKATSADISGKVTATSGSIGGWDIGTTTLSSGTNNIVLDAGNKKIYINNGTFGSSGIQLDYNAGIPRAYIGDGSNKYLKWDGSNLTYSGGKISLPASGTDLALMGWQFTGTFSATDYQTVAWTAGTLTFLNGDSFSITAGNTGAMTGTTYIYFDKNVSQTSLQITTTASQAVGNDKVLIAVSNKVADTTKKATYQVFGGSGGIGGTFISADNIAANTITGNEIAANTITANNIAAGAITADKVYGGTINALLGHYDEFNYTTSDEVLAVYTKNSNTTLGVNSGYIDITSGTELIRNGSFEEGLSFWSTYEGQTATIGNGTMTWTIDSITKKDGSYALKVTNTATNNYEQTQIGFIVQPNTTYYFSGWMKTDNVSTGPNYYQQSRFYYYIYNSSSWVALSQGNFGNQQGTKDWTNYTSQITTPSNAAYMIICCFAGAADSGTATTWFDKIRLSTSSSDYDVKAVLQKTYGDYKDFNYQAKLKSVWTSTQYNACDSITGWSVGYGSAALTIDTSDKKEGTGSLVFNKIGTAAPYMYINYSLANQDLSAYDYFSFWFKTPPTQADLDKIIYINGFFYTTSNSTRWDFFIDKQRCFPLPNTWYRIIIDKKKFSARYGTLNWADIDGFQLFVYTYNATNTLGNMKIDDISFQNIRGIEQGIYFRATDENNCYRFCTISPHKVALQKLQNGIITNLATADYDTTTSQNYYFGVRCNGGSIKCFINTSSIDFNNDTPVIDTTDTTYTAGKIGIYNNVAKTNIDDLLCGAWGTITGGTISGSIVKSKGSSGLLSNDSGFYFQEDGKARIGTSNGSELSRGIYFDGSDVEIKSKHNKFFIEDENSGNNYLLGEGQNLLYDHGFELLDSMSLGKTDNCSCVTTETTVRLDSASKKYAQSFSIILGGGYDYVEVYGVSLRIKSFNTDNIPLTVRIETDNAGVPSGTLVNSDATVTINDAGYSSGDFVWAQTVFQFNNSFALTSGTTYWIVISSSGVSSTSYYELYHDSTSDSYSGGQSKYYNGTSWSSLTGDFFFAVHNNSGSDRSPFINNYYNIGTWYNYGFPRIKSDRYINIEPRSSLVPIFDYQSALVNNKNYYISKVVSCRPSQNLTFSCYAGTKGDGSNTLGASISVVCKIEAFKYGANPATDPPVSLGSTTETTQITSSYSTSDDTKIVRAKVNYTTPTDTAFVMVSFYSANSEWIRVDGCQLVTGDYPVSYNTESNLWNLANQDLGFDYTEYAATSNLTLTTSYQNIPGLNATFYGEKEGYLRIDLILDANSDGVACGTISINGTNQAAEAHAVQRTSAIQSYKILITPGRQYTIRGCASRVGGTSGTVWATHTKMILSFYSTYLK